MQQIEREIRAGKFVWSLEAEDVHLNIERRLTALVGEAGKRLHTGRSRNDQVATDMRLYVRDEIDALIALLQTLQLRLIDAAEQYADVVMPGFTHLQVAQPVTFGHHLMAYVEMFERDRERLRDARRRVNRLPLGAAALAGTTYPIDRLHVAKTLGFEAVCSNSLDAVSDRDFAIEFCACASLILVHLSRLSEELILWVSPRYGFVTIADRFCTGSSIMPQKKNPDVPELVRGKSGRVIGHLMGLLVFDTIDTLRDCLSVFADMVTGIRPVPARMRAAALEGYATATDLADYLVCKGIAFRDAHEIVAAAVKAAETKGCDLADLSLKELQVFSARMSADVKGWLTLEGSLARRAHLGGTAPTQVRRAAAQARQRLKK
jgi:argininosuccinate lyase